MSGVLLLDKPAGITSQSAVSKAKRLFAATKAGHTGTLDPLATGLLPICFGEATKFSHLLLDADKTYAATVRLGVTTTTGDMEGTVTATAPAAFDRPVLEAVLKRFAGEILQTPPMYSAVKHAGKPLYKYARAGLKLARAPRRVCIRRIEFADFTRGEMRILVTCSKGTYIRVLAEDIGRELGCGACLAALRRTAVGGFNINATVKLDALCDMAPDRRDARTCCPSIRWWPRCRASTSTQGRRRNSQAAGRFKVRARLVRGWSGFTARAGNTWGLLQSKYRAPSFRVASWQRRSGQCDIRNGFPGIKGDKYCLRKREVR